MAVKAVLLDLMFTVVVLPRGTDRFDAYARMLDEVGYKLDHGEVEEIYGLSRAKIEHNLTYQGPAPKDFYAAKWSLINAEMTRMIAERHGLPALSNPLCWGAQVYERLMADPMLYEVRPEMEAFLATLSANGVQVVLATNQQQVYVNGMLRYFELREKFDRIFVSDEVGYEKPDPRFFKTIFDQLGLEPHEAAMLGNNPKNDLVGASNAGIGTLLLLGDKKPDESMVGDLASFVWAADPNEFLPRIIQS